MCAEVVCACGAGVPGVCPWGCCPGGFLCFCCFDAVSQVELPGSLLLSTRSAIVLGGLSTGVPAPVGPWGLEWDTPNR